MRRTSSRTLSSRLISARSWLLHLLREAVQRRLENTSSRGTSDYLRRSALEEITRRNMESVVMNDGFQQTRGPTCPVGSPSGLLARALCELPASGAFAYQATRRPPIRRECSS